MLFCKLRVFRNLFSTFCRIRDNQLDLQDKYLIDRFSRKHTYLRISITERCNLRCSYCMPPEGVDLTPNDKLMTSEEILRLSRLFVQMGVTKIRLTGGEPTVRKDLMTIMAGLHTLVVDHNLKDIGITSNGIALKSKLKALKEYGLTHLNISLDTLNESTFLFLTKRNGLRQTMSSIEEAISQNIPKIKVNTVLMRGINDREVLDFVELAKDLPITLRFIEYMPFEGNKWHQSKMLPEAEVVQTIRARYPDFRREVTEETLNDTSNVYIIPSFKGKIGFISSMTIPFCRTCNRLRLTADGSLKVCLFGNEEVNLLKILRNNESDDNLKATIGKAVRSKAFEHGDSQILSKLPNRPMIKIGGYHTLSPAKDRARLSHIDSKGQARVVNISEKEPCFRRAVASGCVKFSDRTAISLIKEGNMKKGDILCVSKVAGILAAKQTHLLIPLCHSISLSGTEVQIEIDEENNLIRVTSIMETCHSTGVEMEALTATSVACLSIYDCAKAVDPYMTITDISLIEKTKRPQSIPAK